MTSTSTTNTLRLYLTNAFGIASKFGDFRHALALHSPDIAIVTETKLTVEKMSQADTATPGYGPPMRLDRTAQGGGVAVWVRNDLAAIELGMVPRDHQEIIWFTVRLRCGRTAVVAALYRPGSAPEGDTSLMEYLDRTLDAARCHGTQLILAGDFNVHSDDWLHTVVQKQHLLAKQWRSSVLLITSPNTCLSQPGAITPWTWSFPTLTPRSCLLCTHLSADLTMPV